jgi:alpha-tubulin suppressor-like RCC1 family protein
VPSGPKSAATVVPEAVYSFGVAGGDGKILELDHSVPARVAGIPGRVVEVATSNSDAYALTSRGTVWAWGAGGLGELGDGSMPRFSGTPVRVDFPPGVRIASLPNPMPYNSGLAIDSRDNLWGWGYNPVHALCLPGGPLPVPARLPASGVSMASGAGDHLVFLSGGKVYACGLNQDGELGNGTTSNRATPTAVVGLPPGVVSLVSSWQGSGALLSNGSYYDWGFNQAGQMGNGTTVNALVPVRVALPGPVTQVWQGGSNATNGQTLALLANGSVWAWGAGSLGQLGDGSTHNSPLPVRVELPAGVRISEVCSGGDTSYALSSSGRLWSWGGNLFGQLGDHHSGLPRLTPSPVHVVLEQISATATNVAGLAP